MDSRNVTSGSAGLSSVARPLSAVALGAAALALSQVATAQAPAMPRWEVGISTVGLYAPDYRGADQMRTRGLVLPYVIYRGEVLRADRDGLRAQFLKSDRVEFNFSAGLGLPVNADRNLARRGMREIDWVLEFGPAMNVKLATSDDGHHDLQLRLPVRAAFALDGGLDYVGTLFAPNLRATFRNVAWAGGTQLRVSTGPVFATADYHRFYYGVEPQFATATRPAFEPKAGYSGWDLSASAARIVGNWRLFAFSGVDIINGARFEDSPLIRRLRRRLCDRALRRQRVVWRLARDESRKGVADRVRRRLCASCDCEGCISFCVTSVTWPRASSRRPGEGRGPRWSL